MAPFGNQKITIKRIGDIAEIVSGATPKTGIDEYWNGSIPWATPKDLSRLNEIFIEHTENSITEAGLKSCSTRMLPANSVLFSSRAPIGHVAINRVPMCTNQGFKSLIPRDGIDPVYLYFCLKAITPNIQRLGRGATFKEVSKAIVENVPVPIPSLDVQLNIARLLQEVTLIRKKREESLGIVDQLLQATFIKMFGDPVANPMKWPDHKFGEFIDFMTSGSRGWGKYYAESGARFIRVQNLTGNFLSFDDMAYVQPPEGAETTRTKVRPGDLLLTITGVVGLAAVAPSEIGEAYVNQHVALLRLRKGLLPEYAANFIRVPSGGQYHFARCQYGQTRPGLNLTNIREMPVLIPPIDEQERFVSVLEVTRRLREQQQRSANDLSMLFSAMLSKAFGES